ncbi:DUF1385 domain-containing protein [Candidatus Peregrinibacteria bacterium]|nr:DUF1385 domain-containing protein [Candidatus Peregrinibacteria bacterium]
MNIFKKANFLVMSWTVEALNKTADDEIPKNAADKPIIDFAVGGQAVIEGVMMRSPNNLTIAVRKPDGTIKVKKRKFKTFTQRHKWLNMPIVRGVINLVEMMIVGSEAINYSAAESMEDEPTHHAKKSFDGETGNVKTKKTSHLAKIGMAIMYIFSFAIAIIMSIGLFKFVPLWITTWLDSQSAYIHTHYIIFNLIDGVIKMSIFLSYIYILSLFPSFHRIFEYHGAEHKSIFNYESHEPLTVTNAKKQIRFHPRCGTSFILIVFLISILFYTFVPKQPDFWANFAVRLALLPFIAGISYEYLKLSAKHANNTIVKALIAPGLWFQRLTTQEPDEKQLAVGLQSLQAALEMEKSNTI